MKLEIVIFVCFDVDNFELVLASDEAIKQIKMSFSKTSFSDISEKSVFDAKNILTKITKKRFPDTFESENNLSFIFSIKIRLSQSQIYQKCLPTTKNFVLISRHHNNVFLSLTIKKRSPKPYCYFGNMKRKSQYQNCAKNAISMYLRVCHFRKYLSIVVILAKSQNTERFKLILYLQSPKCIHRV